MKKLESQIMTLAQSVGATKTTDGRYYHCAIHGVNLQEIICLILNYFDLEIVRLPEEKKLRKRSKK